MMYLPDCNFINIIVFVNLPTTFKFILAENS